MPKCIHLPVNAEMNCQRCGGVPSHEHEEVHRLIDAIHAAIVTIAKEKYDSEGHGVKLWNVTEALLSITASYIDWIEKDPSRRTQALKKCEEFFRLEYVS